MSAFKVFPAIDLKEGCVVRLREGDMAQSTIFSTDPADQAQQFGAHGAQWLHLVDLDGAFAGAPVNRQAVEKILASFDGFIQLGGGIRDEATIERWLALGVHRIVLGTAALKSPALVRASARAYPARIVVAVDARDGLVATEGWADVSDVTVIELAQRFEDAGVAALLFTDVGRDGLLKGVNVEATVALAEQTRLPVIASGGVASIADIERLIQESRTCRGVIEGVICGRALYDGRLDLSQALDLAKAA